MNRFHILTAKVIFTIAIASLGFAEVCFGDEAIWVEEHFKHKEEPRDGGGDVQFRDVFKKDGYYLFDFAIRRISIRGRGSENAESAMEAGAAIIAMELGPIAGALSAEAARREKERLQEQLRSGSVGIRIVDEKALVITGTVRYGALFESGGNVEYRVSGLFVKTDDIKAYPKRFSIAKARSRNLESDKRKIETNVGIPIGRTRQVSFEGKYRLQNLYRANKGFDSMLDVHAERDENGVELSPEGGGEGRQWEIKSVGDGEYTIENNFRARRRFPSALDIHAEEEHVGLELSTYGTNLGRRWRIVAVGEGVVEIENAYRADRDFPAILDVHAEREKVGLELSKNGEGDGTKWRLLRP